MSSKARELASFEYPVVGGEPVGPLRIELPAADPEVTAQREQAAHEEGRREGQREAQQRARQELEQALGRERQAIAAAVKEFQTEQRKYRERVEAEVVRLAMSIARRILRREVQLDPLLLAGAVRVALEQLPREETRLRVAPAAAERWRQYLAQQTELEPPPEVVADEALAEPDCVLESRLGQVEMSLEGQLGEIERGLERLLGPCAPEAA
jgi:flagellar assembly protein FliH